MKSLFFLAVVLTTVLVEGAKEDVEDKFSKSELGLGPENDLTLALLSANSHDFDSDSSAFSHPEELSSLCRVCLSESIINQKRQFNAWGGKRSGGGLGSGGFYGKLSSDVYRQVLDSLPVRIIRGPGFNPWGGKRMVVGSSGLPEATITTDARVPKNDASKPRFNSWGGK